MKYRNNPLNIRYTSSNQWNGLCGSSNGFCEFQSLGYGLRAAIIIINSYKSLYNIDTIEDIIYKWAPPSENNSSGYVSFVCDQMNCCKSQKINVFKPITLFELFKAMCKMESNFYLSISEFDLAYSYFIKTLL